MFVVGLQCTEQRLCHFGETIMIGDLEDCFGWIFSGEYKRLERARRASPQLEKGSFFHQMIKITGDLTKCSDQDPIQRLPPFFYYLVDF
ncbi:hypothetical protein C7H10_07395 [Marinobacter shengliensis]|nr:hypothetical protein C7H10_07395 [Marinobacter shengliensis]